jgi:hypothetical protein
MLIGARIIVSVRQSEIRNPVPHSEIRNPQSVDSLYHFNNFKATSRVAGVIKAERATRKLFFRKSLTGSLVLSYTKRVARSCELRTMKENSNVNELDT